MDLLKPRKNMEKYIIWKPPFGPFKASNSNSFAKMGAGLPVSSILRNIQEGHSLSKTDSSRVVKFPKKLPVKFKTSRNHYQTPLKTPKNPL